jgi:hypothetical protein
MAVLYGGKRLSGVSSDEAFDRTSPRVHASVYFHYVR